MRTSSPTLKGGINNIRRLSIIIPHYEKQRALEKVLDELTLQISPEEEIIIVDDHSPSGIPDCECPTVKVIQPKKRGPHIYRLNTLRNTGIRHAKHDAILILDPDCLPEPHLLKKAREKYYRNAIYGGRIDFQQSDGTIKEDPRVASRRGDIYGGLMLFSKKRTRRVGWFDTDFDGNWGLEDIDFAYKCHRAGLIVAYTQTLKVTHLYHPESREGHEKNKRLFMEKRRAEGGRRTEKLRMLIIVDVYDWAWDIASLELLEHLPEIRGEVISIKDFRRRNVDPDTYDVVMMYPWGAGDVMTKLNPENTVVCIAGGEQLQNERGLKHNCGRFDVFGANNEAIQRQLELWFPEKRVVVLSHGVDTELFKPSPVLHRYFSVGWVGWIPRPIKRFNLAKQIVSQAEASLNVAGFHDMKKIKEDMAYRSHEEMPIFYNECDVLLVTSEYEAHPLVVYEAMGCGLPVISTRVGDVDKSIVNGVNGFILEVDAPVSKFVEKINMLKNDRSLRVKMGKSARRTVLEKWTWSKIANQYRVLWRDSDE